MFIRLSPSECGGSTPLGLAWLDAPAVAWASIVNQSENLRTPIAADVGLAKDVSAPSSRRTPKEGTAKHVFSEAAPTTTAKLILDLTPREALPIIWRSLNGHAPSPNRSSLCSRGGAS